MKAQDIIGNVSLIEESDQKSIRKGLQGIYLDILSHKSPLRHLVKAGAVPRLLELC